MPFDFNAAGSRNTFGKPVMPEPTKQVGNTNKQPTIEFTLTEPKFAMNEMILSEKTRDELLTVINANRCWNKVFVEWGLQDVIKQRKSILINLYGESGTGKTMAAHAVAKELGKKLVCVNYADIESKYVGETSKNLTSIFKYASEQNAILFFDEADALLSRRVTNMSNSTDVSVNQTRSVLLTLMNDYEGMIIFTTNFISNFDSAFMRRIQYHIYFEMPNSKLREMLWRKYIPQRMPTDTDFRAIAEAHDGISGSDIANAVLKAALKAAMIGDNMVRQRYFEDAVRDILKSKNDNKKITDVTITKRPVTEEYALSQLKKQEEKP
ncbi:MAG: ATP-binding protein [Ruminococcus sp.]|nr:ATP-binding protein [Ruminococcus sp.]